MQPSWLLKKQVLKSPMPKFLWIPAVHRNIIKLVCLTIRGVWDLPIPQQAKKITNAMPLSYTYKLTLFPKTNQKITFRPSSVCVVYMYI